METRRYPNQTLHSDKHTRSTCELQESLSSRLETQPVCSMPCHIRHFAADFLMLSTQYQKQYEKESTVGFVAEQTRR